MKYKVTTYRTLTGTKDVLELAKKVSAQWIIYQNKKPKYHVNCFDLLTESNLQMNSLVLCNKKPIEDVLKTINKKQNINLSLAKLPLIEIEVKSEPIELELPPLPLEWLS